MQFNILQISGEQKNPHFLGGGGGGKKCTSTAHEIANLGGCYCHFQAGNAGAVTQPLTGRSVIVKGPVAGWLYHVLYHIYGLYTQTHAGVVRQK